MRKLILLICLFSFGFLSKAQTNFFGTVSIEFEKTVSVHQLMKANEPEWYEEAKDHTPAETKSYFDFTGDSTHSLYKQTREAEIPAGMWYRAFADENIVYNDYSKGTTISQKPVFEENFLVDDSLLKIKWKITSDTRNIAGFECRKAIGFIFDTVAIFAFYTDEIMINGGPEGIHGLPGMILGVGIPRIHTTWFATKVRVNDVKMDKVKPVTKGKRIKRDDMIRSIDKALKDWGKYGKNLVMNYLI